MTSIHHSSNSDQPETIDFNNDGDEYLSSDDIEASTKARIAGYLNTERSIPCHFIAVFFVLMSLTLICIGLCIKALFGHSLEMGDKEVLSIRSISYPIACVECIR